MKTFAGEQEKSYRTTADIEWLNTKNALTTRVVQTLGIQAMSIDTILVNITMVFKYLPVSITELVEVIENKLLDAAAEDDDDK